MALDDALNVWQFSQSPEHLAKVPHRSADAQTFVWGGTDPACGSRHELHRCVNRFDFRFALDRVRNGELVGDRNPAVLRAPQTIPVYVLQVEFHLRPRIRRLS